MGSKDPAGSLLASDSVRRPKREKTRTEEAVREGRFMEFAPCGVRAGGTDKQLSPSWFRKVGCERVSYTVGELLRAS
jgi:hypothetical protein